MDRFTRERGGKPTRQGGLALLLCGVREGGGLQGRAINGAGACLSMSVKREKAVNLRRRSQSGKKKKKRGVTRKVVVNSEYWETTVEKKAIILLRGRHVEWATVNPNRSLPLLGIKNR